MFVVILRGVASWESERKTSKRAGAVSKLRISMTAESRPALAHLLYHAGMHRQSLHIPLITLAATFCVATAFGHGTVVDPPSRVYRVYKSNPERPNFDLARKAVLMDGKSSYYTWNEVSRNIPQAVRAKLPPGFDYSPWVPDGQIASAGRVDKNVFSRTYKGLDQISGSWPKKAVTAGKSITVDFFATAPHNPSVWDVWMTKPGWKPSSPLRWKDMQFLGRPNPTFANRHYKFPLSIPADRSGHHVLVVIWQRNDRGRGGLLLGVGHRRAASGELHAVRPGLRSVEQRSPEPPQPEPAGARGSPCCSRPTERRAVRSSR